MRKNRELAGIDGAMSSSVMEYTSNWYERIQPLGDYDRAAIAYGYGDLVEAYKGPASAQAPRETFHNYAGGEVCEQDSDCPYASSGALASQLLDSNMKSRADAALRRKPARAPAPSCARASTTTWRRKARRTGRYTPLKYRFCTDERADTTLAWCNRFDEGASYRDMVRNVEEDYERMYPFAAFRRYRKSFDIGTYQDALLGRRLNGAAKRVPEHVVRIHVGSRLPRAPGRVRVL